MTGFPSKLSAKLQDRIDNGLHRKLSIPEKRVDFTSNDYLGFARNHEIFQNASSLLKTRGIPKNGATGSRLLSGNHGLYRELENFLCSYHKCAAALVFNSGYDANLGFFGTVPQKGDVVFHDEWIHASIRDGIHMSPAKNYKFKHNDLEDLRTKLDRILPTLSFGSQKGPVQGPQVYVVTEAVFSMDGDAPDLGAFSNFCKERGCYLVVDEAHALGIYGNKGEGKVQSLDLQETVFARIVTFGKALGGHGAAVLGCPELKDYLINFARSFVYTTALPPHSIATVLTAYQYLSHEKGLSERDKLVEIVGHFKKRVLELGLEAFYIPSDSAIHCCMLPGNEKVRGVAQNLAKQGFDVKPILSPTVPKGRERLRFCLHSFNTKKEIQEVLKVLSKNLQKL